jgi:Trk-type K+ transport system membrane component
VYKTLLFLHLLGVFLIVGGAAIATAIGIKLSKTAHA